MKLKGLELNFRLREIFIIETSSWLQKGSWQCFKGNSSEENNLICRVDRTLKSFSRTEFEIFPGGEIGEESKSDFKMKGSPFYRSCTIYRGDTILAQVMTL